MSTSSAWNTERLKEDRAGSEQKSTSPHVLPLIATGSNWKLVDFQGYGNCRVHAGQVPFAVVQGASSTSEGSVNYSTFFFFGSKRNWEDYTAGVTKLSRGLLLHAESMSGFSLEWSPSAFTPVALCTHWAFHPKEGAAWQPIDFTHPSLGSTSFPCSPSALCAEKLPHRCVWYTPVPLLGGRFSIHLGSPCLSS